MPPSTKFSLFSFWTDFVKGVSEQGALIKTKLFVLIIADQSYTLAIGYVDAAQPHGWGAQVAMIRIQ